jgi:transcriptional regulator GlxA family with amidase domain
LERTTGLSPVRFVQRLRVERAVELLETTRLPFDEVARRVGYAEPSTLRRLLRREGIAGAREIRAAG